MAITPFGSFSVTFANLATKISGQAATVKGYFDSIGNDIKTYINDTLIPALSSTADGSSGADQIGATSIPGLTGNTVQALLESAKNAVDSIDIASAVAPVEEAINEHLADTMPHRFVDGTTTYRWGLAVIDGVVNMVYEEVV